MSSIDPASLAQLSRSFGKSLISDMSKKKILMEATT